MATIQRPVKEGSVRTYQAKVGLGYVDILASEMDADLDTIYAAWNGGISTVDLGNGSVTYAKLAPDAQLWQDTGTKLIPGPNFVTRPVLVSGTNNPLEWGALTIKGRLNAHPSQGYVYMSTNALQNAGATAWTQDSAGFPSWLVTLNTQTDGFLVSRAPAGGQPAPFLSMDSSGHLTLNAAPDTQLTIGTALIKGTVSASTGGDLFLLSNNSYAPGATTYPSWHIMLGPTNDAVQFYRRAANAAAGGGASLFALVSNGDLVIAGSNATKGAPGTAWINPSDARLKKNVTDDPRGLDAICALRPILYEFNGLANTKDDGQVHHGLLADEVAAVMPEAVGTTSLNLRPEDVEPTEVQTLDVSNITYALINAVKDLASRVTALETPA